jgi:hypothetical protein
MRTGLALCRIVLLPFGLFSSVVLCAQFQPPTQQQLVVPAQLRRETEHA